MYKFLDSNLLQTIVTLIVGLFAFIIYKLNKRDERRRAATILIMEIREIEASLKRLSDIGMNNLYSSSPIINENSWAKYKFMFIRKLDQDEYEHLSDFYTTACRIEEERLLAIKQIANGFEIKCKALHESVVNLARYEPDLNTDEFLLKTKQIADKVYLNTPGFEGDLPKDLMNSLLKNIRYITTSTAGQKIKKIACIR